MNKPFRVLKLVLLAAALFFLVFSLVAVSQLGRIGIRGLTGGGDKGTLSDLFPLPESQIVTGLVDSLDNRFYYSSKLNYPKLYTAALEGARGELKERGVAWDFQKIDPWDTEEGARESFEKEFDRALEAGKSAKDLGKHDLAFAGANALLKSLGRSHSYFLYPPGHPKGFPVSGSFVGIGAAIGKMEDGALYFSKIFHGSPAEKAGLMVFDRPVLVDGKQAPNDPAALAAMVRGERGTKVKLTIERQGQRLEFEIQRDKVDLPTAEARIVEDGKYHWAVVELSGFEPEAYKKLLELIRDLGVFSPGVDGIVLDLRGNPGGDLEILRLCLSWFLPRDATSCVFVDEAGSRKIYASRGPVTDKPVVVLIDGHSASASEIFAAAMQEYHRATIIGKKSAGAVEVGNVVPLAYGAEAMITIAQVYTASDKIMEGVGVIPDIESGLTDKDVLAGRDPCLDKAMEALRNEKEPK